MTRKMVSGFRRSLSFPNNHHPSSNQPPKPKKTFHVRSASLPCGSHPLIPQLKDEIHELKITWSRRRFTSDGVVVKDPPAPVTSSFSSAWLCEGLSRLKSVHESLDDILQLPQTRESLRSQSPWIEKLLDDFLRFVDVFGIFQTLILNLKQDHLAAVVAVRRKDDSATAFYLKSLKKLGKQAEKLVTTVRCIGKHSAFPSPSPPDAELAEAIRDVDEVTVMVSTALFNGISESFASRRKSTSSWMGLKSGAKKVGAGGGIHEMEQVLGCDLRKKKGDEEIKMASRSMNAVEECIAGIESGSQSVLRSLINTRVSLLNLLTQQ